MDRIPGAATSYKASRHLVNQEAEERVPWLCWWQTWALVSDRKGVHSQRHSLLCVTVGKSLNLSELNSLTYHMGKLI